MPAAPADPNLLVGTETSDDAGVYLLASGLALVQTVDFFPPLVDDPYAFGQIAAANALSDVYAMNGEPRTVLNLAGFPDDQLPLEILSRILEGAAERVLAAGAVTVGGHTVRDAEIKFGLSVTGVADPATILTNAAARPGDDLVLTKPLGTGFVTTAAKKDSCPDDVLSAAIASMSQLNAIGRDALRASGGVHSATDVTGFGLAGHSLEMARGSKVTVVLDTRRFPRLPGVEPLCVPRFHTRGSKNNREFCADVLRIDEHADLLGVELAFDAQTSGGLLLSVDPAHTDDLLRHLESAGAAAAVIGRVTVAEPGVFVVLT